MPKGVIVKNEATGMSELNVTLIDVGWGDSILIEFRDGEDYAFGLIDCNDTKYLQSSYIFIKRHLEKTGIDVTNKPVFEFIMLSHAHTDHGQGLKAIMKSFGTRNFWYPKSKDAGCLAGLIGYANRSSNVHHHEAINSNKEMPDLRDVALVVHWPPYNIIDPNENNNSVVLELTLDEVSFVLTGDAEASVWQQIANRIPSDTQVFKVPHHGSVNGSFDGTSPAGWYARCPDALLAISSHVRPFSHPDQEVINLFKGDGRRCYRTDDHYHLTFWTDGTNVKVKYSHM